MEKNDFSLLYSKISIANRNNIAHGEYHDFGKLNVILNSKESILIFSKWLDEVESQFLNAIKNPWSLV